MSAFLIVGRKFSGLARYMRARGIDYMFLADSHFAINQHKRYKRRRVADFSSSQAVLEAVDVINKKQPIQGVVSTYEGYILAAAEIAHHLQLSGLPLEAARACTDKFLMRQKFATAPRKISPAFAVVENETDLLAFSSEYGFPLILKPANLQKSLLVTKNLTRQELLANYRKTLEQIPAVYKKYAPHHHPKLIIEEFMEGPIHSVDAFVDSSGEPHVLQQVVDYQTGYDIGYDDNFHYSRLLPSGLPASEVEDVRQVAALGCRALGIKNSPAHIEIIRTKDGPQIVEIGARNGGYRERMHRLANGIDIQAAALSIASGHQPQITATKNEPCAVLELFPKVAGKFKAISNQDKLENLKSLQYFSLKVEAGKFVGKAADGYKMCAVIILHNADVEQFNKDLDFVNNHVEIVTN